MTPAILPCSPVLLRAAITAAWPGCRDAAGADPRSRIIAHPALRGGYTLSILDGVTHAPRAAENVARALEDIGYEVARETGSPPRVVGVLAEAAREPWEQGDRGDRLQRERAERDAAVAPGVDAKRQGAESRDAAAYGRGAGA